MLRIKQHLKENTGDANVSKVTLIAIVFVVGAICLIMVSSAFQGPVGEWFSETVHDWFKDTTGDFTYRLTFESMGIEEGATYAGYDSNGQYFHIVFTNDEIHCKVTLDGVLVDGGTIPVTDLYKAADGTICAHGKDPSAGMTISEDKSKLYFNGGEDILYLQP